MGRQRFFALKLLASLFLAGSTTALFATSNLPSCGAGTLSSYETNTLFPGGGCAIGILDYYDFSYHQVSNAPLASDIEVNLASSGTGFGFTRVDGTPFTAALGQTVKFEIDYDIVIDPAPIIGGGDMSLDPPSGNVSVIEYFCNDNAYVFSGFCLGNSPSPETLQVGTVPPLNLTASITFVHPATVSQQVGILFTLDGTNGPSSFDGLDATSIISGVPEPATAGGLLLGLLALGGSYKLRRQRTN